MERLTYMCGGKWRLRIGDTEYSGKAVDRLAAYEGTGLEPEEIEQLKTDVMDIKRSVDDLWEKQDFLKFLEKKGCDTNAGVSWMCEVFDMLHDEMGNELIDIDNLRELVGDAGGGFLQPGRKDKRK